MTESLHLPSPLVRFEVALGSVSKREPNALASGRQGRFNASFGCPRLAPTAHAMYISGVLKPSTVCDVNT